MYIPQKLSYEQIRQLRLGAYELVQDHNLRFGQAFINQYAINTNRAIHFEDLFYTDSVDEAEALIQEHIAGQV